MMCCSFMESSLKIDSTLKSQRRDLESREMDPTIFLSFLVTPAHAHTHTHTHTHSTHLHSASLTIAAEIWIHSEIQYALIFYTGSIWCESFGFGLQLCKIAPAGLFYNSFNSNVVLNKLYNRHLLTRNIFKTNKKWNSCEAKQTSHREVNVVK